MGALFITNTVLRGMEFVFLVITLGLTGSLIENQFFGDSRVNFMMFASVWGLLIGVFYGFAALFISVLAMPMIIVLVDFLTAVFTFSAATALAVAIRVHSCSNHFYIDNNKVAQGSSDRCRKAQADTAFMYFAFFTFLASLIISVTIGFREGWGAFGPRKSTAPRPSMTQVA